MRGVALGAGYFAPYHYEAWTRIPEAEIVAMFNPTEDRAAPIMARYGVPRYYGNWKEMIDREAPDFVDIITPPETHEDICRYAAERGVHIICQKPLAPIVRHQSNASSSSHAPPVFASWCTRTSAGSPGTASSSRSRPTASSVTSPIFVFSMRTGDGWGADAYLARQPFFRDYPRLLRVRNRRALHRHVPIPARRGRQRRSQLRRLNPVIKGEDAGQLILTFASGATAIWDANRYNEDETEFRRDSRSARCASTPRRGHLTLDTDVDDPDQAARRARDDCRLPARQNVNFAGDCVYVLQRHFVDCMLSGREFESNGADYLATIRVVEAAYESAQTGQVVRLETSQGR